MEISVKDLYAVAEATKAMAAKMRESADSAAVMAKAVQTIVDDCAAQLKATKENVQKEASVAGKPAAKSESPAETSAHNTNANDQSAPAKSEPTPEAKKISLEEFRAYVIERTNPNTREDIKALLRYYNVKNLTNLPEEHYAQFMETVDKLYKGEEAKP